MLLILLILDETIVLCLSNNCRCCKFFSSMTEKKDELELVSDDYYEQLDLRYIISEYRRTRVEKLAYE